MGIGADLIEDGLDYWDLGCKREYKQITKNKRIMTKSKVKEVVKASEPDDNNNIWHHLVMENGDKIDIGKRNLQKVGWELDYEWKDEDDQQEFRKAKTPKKDFKPSSQPTGDNLKGIKIGHAISNAVILFCSEGKVHDKPIDESIKEYATMIYKLSEELNNEI